MVIDAIINGTIIFVKKLVFFRPKNERNSKKAFLKSTGNKISKNVQNVMSKYQKKGRQWGCAAPIITANMVISVIVALVHGQIPILQHFVAVRHVSLHLNIWQMLLGIEYSALQIKKSINQSKSKHLNIEHALNAQLWSKIIRIVNTQNVAAVKRNFALFVSQSKSRIGNVVDTQSIVVKLHKFRDLS